jgi:hypothetical protein
VGLKVETTTTTDRKLHLHIKVRQPADAALALDCARFVAQTATEWSAGLTRLHSLFVFTVAELPESIKCEVDADVPGLPNTSKALSLLGQTWFEDQLAISELATQARAERARKAAQARWGKEGEQ